MDADQTRAGSTFLPGEEVRLVLDSVIEPSSSSDPCGGQAPGTLDVTLVKWTAWQMAALGRVA
jgi:hypothetical protein